MRNYFLSILLVFFSYSNSFCQVDHWEFVILEGDTYQYQLPTEQPSSDWINADFDDSNWTTGVSGFGYSDGDDRTQIPNPTITIYLRRSFNIVDLSAIEEVIFYMDYDDGFVAYLNGQEIQRGLVSGNPPAYDQPADGLHEALLYQGQTPLPYSIDGSLLKNGDNILAIEVHNESATSSDLTAIPFLSLGINNESKNYRESPSWFVPPRSDEDFTASNLPIILIETVDNREIPDEPKIAADMSIIYRGAGEQTLLTDISNSEYVNYRGKIQIEVRGSTSQDLPKKQYSFTTYDNAYLNKDNVSLLGFPEENDFILNGLAFEPSLIRDYLTYNLARDLGEYVTRTQYCEVVLNGDYVGLYVLQEKIKADNNRVDINKVDPEDNQLPNLSGGYIIKSDKTTGNDPVAWEMPNSSGWNVQFIHHIPSPEDITQSQTNYIKSVFEDLERQAINNSLTSGFPSIIDVPSFVDFMLLNELASNPDAYQFSTFFHKDRNGKLRAGPLWDINLSYGNDLFDLGFDRSHTNVWQFEFENSGATFWKSLFYNSQFRCYLSKRWNELSQSDQPLNIVSLHNRIDEIVSTIAEAGERDRARWGINIDHNQEIQNMKSWLSTRVNWMNNNIGSFSNCANVETPDLVITKIHYHPEDNEFDQKDQEFIEIYNNESTSVSLRGYYFSGTGLVYLFPSSAVLESKQSIVLANDKETFLQAYGQAPFGEYSRSLSNKSQTLTLADAFGNIIDQVTYSDETPWPQEADGDGYYLELKDPTLDNSIPENWMASEVRFSDALYTKHTDKTLMIYPNPVIDVLHFQSKVPITNLVLRSLSGQIIFTLESPKTKEQFDINSLKTGIYILELRYPDGIIRSAKVLKR
ncbi:MAG: CotH kinase family protein [Cyclobacteriaceae bacterium]